MRKSITPATLCCSLVIACGPVELADLPTVEVSIAETNLEFRCPDVDAPVVVSSDRLRFSLDCLAVSCTLTTSPGESDCSDPTLNPLHDSCFETLVVAVWDASGSCAESSVAPGFQFASGHSLYERYDRLYFERSSEVMILAEGRLSAPFDSAYERYVFPLED